MPIAKETGGDFTPVPEGTHVAVCVNCIALGTLPDSNYAPTFKIMLGFELTEELIKVDDTEAPMMCSKEYTLSLSEKSNLRRDLQSWRGKEFTEEELKGFAVEKVVGHPCLLTVTHAKSAKGKQYSKITAITKLLKAMPVPKQHHPSFIYEIEHGQNEGFKSLPEWIQKKIKTSFEFNHSSPAPEVQQSPSDAPGF